MQSLNYYLQKAKSEYFAVPHFNVSNLEMIKAIVEASQELNAPVMIGMSESEREFIGLNQAKSIIKCYKEKGAVIFLNADHSKSFDSCKNAIDAGFDSIHFDGSHLNLKENFEITKKVVLYGKKKNVDISIEGELGCMPTESSKIYNKEIKIDKKYFTKPEEAREFTENTGIDRLASVIGSIHGIASNNPHLDIDLIKRTQTKKAFKQPQLPARLEAIVKMQDHGIKSQSLLFPCSLPDHFYIVFNNQAFFASGTKIASIPEFNDGPGTMVTFLGVRITLQSGKVGVEIKPL